MLKNYLTTAARNLKKYRGYSLINILGLAVGMACSILIFLWAYDELHYDTFHPHSERIYRMIVRAADSPSDPGFPSAPYILPNILKAQYQEVEETVRVRTNDYPSPVRYKDLTFYEERFFLADASFFDIFGHTFLQGNPETALNKPNAVVLTRKSAEKYFGDENPLGRILRWNNLHDIEVTGVIEDVPYNSHLQFDFVASLQLYGAERLSTWGRETAAYVRLREGVSVSEFNQKIAGIFQRYHPEDSYTLSLQPVREAHLHIEQGGRGSLIMVFIFVVIAVIILIIACVNFMNITTARSGVRALEVGMRKVVGARRTDIITQFLGEAVLLSLIALISALILVDLFLPTFNRIQGKEMSFFGSMTLPLAGLLILGAVLTGLAAGAYPAVILSSYEPITVLKRATIKQGAVLRSLLVIIQFSVSIVLIIMTLAAHRQMRFIRTADLGFSRDQIVRVQMNDQLRERYTSFKNRLLQGTGIRSITAASALPHLLFNVNNFSWEGQPESEKTEINFLYTDHDYAETFDLEIVAGRDFSVDYATDAEDACLVNEAAVRLMGFDDAVGKKVNLAEEPKTVVGVVRNFHHQPLIFTISPLVMAIRPSWYFDLLVKIDPETASESLAHIEDTFKTYAPDFPFRAAFLDDFFKTVYKPLATINSVFDGFVGLAVFISCLGLFGLSALLLEQRKMEIGIRKVLGATTHGVIIMLSKRFFRIVLVSNLIAIPLAYFMVRFFLGFFVRRTELPLSLFFLGGIFSFAAAGVTISWQVMKIAHMNPTDSIRNE